MENTIEYTNFVPSSDMRSYAEKLVSNLSEHIPDDGSFFVRFSRVKDGIMAEIKMAALQLQMNLRNTAKTFYAALDKATFEVEKELSDWRAARKLC